MIFVLFRQFQYPLFIERALLSDLDCPFIIKYISTVHEESEYYLLFEPLKYGTLDNYISVWLFLLPFALYLSHLEE